MYMQLIKIGVKNLWQRKLNALAAILAFSGVIFIFSIMLALSNGLQSMANSESAASLAVIVKSGAQNEGLSSLNRDSQIKLLDTLSNQFSIKQVSVEAVMSLNLNASAIEQEVPIVLRGMHLPDASARQMTLVSGHWFAAGSDGVVLGQKLASRYPGLSVGQQIQLGPRSWTVVGIFDAGSQFFNGEIWTDLDSLRTSYQRGSSAQSLYFKLPHNHALPDIAKVLEEQVSDAIDLLPATELVARQMQQLTDFLNLILVSFVIPDVCGIDFGWHFYHGKQLFSPPGATQHLVGVRGKAHQAGDGAGYRRGATWFIGGRHRRAGYDGGVFR